MNLNNKLSDVVLKVSIWLTKQRMDIQINGYKNYLWRRRGYIYNTVRLIVFLGSIVLASKVYNNPSIVNELRSFNKVYAVLILLIGYNIFGAKFIARQELLKMIQDHYMEFDTRLKELNEKIDD